MTFKNFPPRQKPGSFTIDQALEALNKSSRVREQVGWAFDERSERSTHRRDGRARGL